MYENQIKKQKAYLTPDEYEALEKMRYELKDVDDLKYAIFLKEQIQTLLARGKRRAFEKEAQEKEQ